MGGPRTAWQPGPALLLALLVCLIVSAPTTAPAVADRPAGHGSGPASAIRVDLPRTPLAVGRPGHLIPATSAVHAGDNPDADPAPAAAASHADPHQRTTGTAHAPDPTTPRAEVPVGRRAPPARRLP